MLVGASLGPYQILEEIGRGGMATVYRARQPSVDRDVAIKVMQRGPVDEAAVQRFQREARLVARLEHPHILPVYDFDGAHDPPYIVMRYLTGGTLEGLMSLGPLPLRLVVGLSRQICAGLDYAHRQGVIHRDIKPSNILIDREGNAFVSDFGIARSATGSSSLRLTQEGIVLGSVEYMSPEQVMGRRDLDHRSDLYSLGIMLFQMLAGRLPFVADPPLGVLAMHIQAPVPSCSEINPNLPQGVDAVMEKALAKKPEDRFPNAVALSQALDDAIGRGGLREVIAAGEQPRPVPVPGLPDTPPRPADESSKTAATGQNRQVVAVYVNSAEYAEVAEAAVGRVQAQRALVDLGEGFQRLTMEAGGEVLLRTDNDMLCVWGAEMPAEDDVERAIRAALAMQSLLRTQETLRSQEAQRAQDMLQSPASGRVLEEPLPLNIGIHCGLATVNPAGGLGPQGATHVITGATISLANRLMQAAYGVVLISHDVYRLVRGVFEVQPDLPLRIRGRSEGLPTYRVSAAKPRAFRPGSRPAGGAETRMVGREAELKRLKYAFLNAVEDGETQVVTITGDAGVGKSRLLDVFDDWCELRPEMFFLFRGRASWGQGQAYTLIHDMIAFRCQIREDDPSQVIVEKLERGIAGMAGGPHSPLADPALAHRIGFLCGYDLADSPYIRPLVGEPALLAAQCRRAFIELISTLAREDFVLMELEDLHLADDDSLELLNEMFKFCASSQDFIHLAVVCAARPALFSRHADWCRGQPFHIRLDLQPLDRRESRELVGEILQKVSEVPRALRDLLVERADGNPLYLEELVKLLIDNRVILADEEAGWQVEETRLAGLKVPPTLAALIETRLDTLLSPERLVLLRAAAFGRLFFDGVLQAMDEEDGSRHGAAARVAGLPDVLAGLAQRKAISQHESSAFAGTVEYSFAQSMLREVVYDLLLDRQRRIYHRAAAEWLSGFDRSGAFQFFIADHYEQAGDWEEAGLAFGQAGWRAYHRGLFNQAEQCFERGLAAVPADDLPGRKRLLLGSGASARALGSHAKARDALDQALRLAVSEKDAASQAEARRLLGMLAIDQNQYSEARKYLEKALPFARQHTDRRLLAAILSGMAEAAFNGGEMEAAHQAARECRDLAAALGDDVLRARAMHCLGAIHVARGEYSQAGEAFASAEELARRVGFIQFERNLQLSRGELSARQGDWGAAVATWTALLKTARAASDFLLVIETACHLAAAYARTGELARVRGMVLDALRTAQRAYSQSGLLDGVSAYGELRLAQGDVAGGMAMLGIVRAHPEATASQLQAVAQAEQYWTARHGLSDTDVTLLMGAGELPVLEDVVSEILAG